LRSSSQSIDATISAPMGMKINECVKCR